MQSMAHYAAQAQQARSAARTLKTATASQGYAFAECTPGGFDWVCGSTMRLLMHDSRSILAARTASLCGSVSQMVSCKGVSWLWTLKYVL